MAYALFSTYVPAKEKYEVTNIGKIKKFPTKPAAKKYMKRKGWTSQDAKILKVDLRKIKRL